MWNWKYIKKLRGPGRYKKESPITKEIQEVIDFINPKNLMDSGEKKLYHLADDVLYYQCENGEPKVIMRDEFGCVFNKRSNTSKKFGYDFLMKNKDVIMSKLLSDFRPQNNIHIH